MEDVLLTTHSAHRGSKILREGITEEVSWTAPASSRLTWPDLSLPLPMSKVFPLSESGMEPSQGCQQVAEAFKAAGPGHAPVQVLVQTLRSKLPRIWLERFLQTVLHVRSSDWQTAHYVLQFRHLRRLMGRVDRRKPLNASEADLARDCISALNLTALSDLDGHCRLAMEAFVSLQAGKRAEGGPGRPEPSRENNLLLYLVRCESLAMVERKNWLEGALMPGDPEAIARLTPELKLLEERLERARGFHERLARFEPTLDVPMGLAEAMGDGLFNRFREGLAIRPELAPFREVLELQHAKRIPSRDLTALATLCRWVQESRGIAGNPLSWYSMALKAYDAGQFRLDLTGALAGVSPLLAEGRLQLVGDAAHGNFGENSYATWIARDGLTRPFRSANPERLAPCMRAIVMANIHRDAVLLRLLESPKVHQTQGLVETLVGHSASPRVHAHIAARPELHSGSINSRVPLALLKSAVSTPLACLQSLLHPSRITDAELQSLLEAQAILRPEVAEAIGAYLRLRSHA